MLIIITRLKIIYKNYIIIKSRDGFEAAKSIYIHRHEDSDILLVLIIIIIRYKVLFW